MFSFSRKVVTASGWFFFYLLWVSFIARNLLYSIGVSSRSRSLASLQTQELAHFSSKFLAQFCWSSCLCLIANQLYVDRGQRSSSLAWFDLRVSRTEARYGCDGLQVVLRSTLTLNLLTPDAFLWKEPRLKRLACISGLGHCVGYGHLKPVRETESRMMSFWLTMLFSSSLHMEFQRAIN